MKKLLHSLILMLAILQVPTAASGAFVQVADGVYRDGSTIYICGGVTSLGALNVNPSVIYSFATVPPACVSNTFTGYGATLHIPPASYGAYFINEYWGNFANMYNDAVEPTGVTISSTTVELNRGNTYNLSATVSPNNASVRSVVWTSTNASIATVTSNGTVTALATGECDIVASCIDKQAVCHVTVLDPFSVTLDQTEVTIEQTQQVTLTATIYPEGASGQNVFWSTTDASVATVNNGVVTGVGIGECDIIASYLDKQAVCHVKVVKTTIVITLDKHEARLLPNHSVTIMPTMSPMETELKVTVSNPEVAAARLVNDVVQVVGLAEGSTMIVVSSVDGQAVPDACMVTVYTEVGDVNCDGYVTISDVTTLIDHLLGSTVAGFNVDNADTNRDGNVTISDVTALIDYLLVGIWPWDEPQTETFTVNGVTFKMVAVEGGTFMMGASDDAPDAYDEENPAHQVTLSSYSIGETEVTQALWQAVMGRNPSFFTSDNGFAENLQRPVEQVSWNDCQIFITRLNELTGKTFRLPTEAEWEFAARGGRCSNGCKYAGSNTIGDVAWYSSNHSSDYATHTVATKDPNELGLYDMSGNVFEWCQDWYDNYRSDAQMNPTGPVSGSGRVIRGGNVFNDASECVVSSRYCDIIPTHGDAGLGLRLVLDEYDSSKFRLSSTVVALEVGGTAIINILNGNGSYSVAGGLDCVNSTVYGEALEVTGATLGITTVHVIDNITAATTVLTVIVKESEIQSESFTVNGVTFKMVAVEDGTFTMGATAEQGSDADNREKPAHEVTLSSYSIGETEVTQELWQAVMGSNPSYHTGNLQRPVECVSWNDCQEFIVKLNQLTGRQFRLPTEAEWEFAARGGNRSQGYKYAGSNSIDDVAWYSSNNSSTTHAVATKSPNELGLYDMSGNVLEWCQDWYDNYSSEAQMNPTGPASGSYRVNRGGSGFSGAKGCRVSFRSGYNQSPTYRDYYIGLRLAL